MKRIIIFLILFLMIHLRPSAQRRFPDALMRRLEGKTKLADIMNEVNRYYDFGRKNIEKEPGEDDFESNDYDWWKKWEYWARRRLLPDGTVADYRSMNYIARQEMEAKFGTELRKAAEEFKNTPPLDDRMPNGNRTTNRDGGGGTTNKSYGGWSSIGPTSGGTVVGSGTNIDINGLARMERIAFHPTNGNIFYVCSPSGGVYKTTNGGTSWTDIGQGLPGGASAIEVARNNGNVIYVFSGDGDSHYSGTFVWAYNVTPISKGVFKSTDAGVTWTKVTDMYTGAGDIVGHNFAISESNSNYLFAATDRGLYRTTDGGNSWTQVRSGNYYDVEFRPYNDSVVYASTASTVEYSTGGGRSGTWSTSTFDFSPASNRIDLGVRKNNLSVSSVFVYALAGQVTASGQFRGLYLSTDGGVSYVRQTNTPNILGTATNGSGSTDQSRYDLGICVRPDNVATLATAGCCVWRSTNSGVTMTYGTTYREGNGPLSAFIHPDVHDVEYNPVNNILYACTDGGVYSSSDDGVTWTNLSSGLAGTQFYHMGMKAKGDGQMTGIMLAAGAQDNGVKYRTSGGSWRHLVCCDGYGAMINGNDDDWVVGDINGPLYQTPDGGVTMNNRASVTSFSHMAVDHDFGDTMYVASGSTLLRSYNGFLSFSSISVNVNNFVSTCPSNNTRLYGSASSATNLRISDDNGSTWTTISGNTGWPAGSPTVTDCKPWPTASAEIYATFGGYTNGVKVYRSVNAGATWTNYSGSLPNVPVHSCAVATEGVYVGTEIGVFFRPDGAADWTPFYTGMPNTIVTDIWVNDNNFVYASTFGRGVWIADRYTVCDAVINVTGALSGPQYFEANTTANVTATSEAGAGSDIFVKSNGYVSLLPGFEMKDGTFFKAYIGPCGTGGIPTTARTGANGSEPNRSIIEYDLKDQARRKLQEINYYTLVSDGIEINMLQNAVVDIEIADTKTGQVKKLVNQQTMTRGMYKVLTGQGTFAVKVRFNGGAVTKL